MIDLNRIQKEELREIVLRVLAIRQGHAHGADYILNRAAQDVSFSIDQDNVEDALHFLRDLNYVKSEQSTLGSSLSWLASAQGVLVYERSQTNRPRHD